MPGLTNCPVDLLHVSERGNFFSDSPPPSNPILAKLVHAMDRPKAVIFDLGGVLISSPLKGIEEYETENGIPHGYLNYAMSVHKR